MNNPQLIIYNASAGAGKTYKLVEEILKLLLKDKLEPYQIIVITFARNAASELLHRTLQDLYNIISVDTLQDLSPETKSKLQNIFNDSLENIFSTIKETAKKSIINLLLEFNTTPILTIDKFILKLFFNYTFLLGFDTSTALKKNNTYSEFIYNSLTESVNKSIEYKELLQTLMEFIEDNKITFSLEKIIFNTNKLIEETIRNIIFPEKNKIKKEELKKVENLFKTGYEKFLQNSTELINQHFGKYDKETLKLLSSEDNIKVFSHKKSNKTYTSIIKYLNNDIKGIINSFLEKEPKNTNRSISYYKVKDPKFSELSVLELHNKIFHNPNKYYYNTYKYIKNNIIPFNILIWKVLDTAYKKIINSDEKNLEIIYFLFNYLIEMQKDLPFELLILVETRLGNIKAILIDEFQDTSTLQYNILKRLMREIPNNIVVGDVKQSIYRWRSAEPSIMTTEIKKDLKNYIEKNLPNNYRSSKNIVNFNNSFYKNLKNFIESKISENYHSIDKYKESIKTFITSPEQIAISQKEGWIKLNKIITPGTTDKKTEVSYNLLLKDIETLTQKYNYKYSDIMILVRKNEHGEELLNFLHHNNIPAYTESSTLTFQNNVNTRLFINTLKFILTTDVERDKIAFELFLDWNIILNNYNYKIPISLEKKKINELLPPEIKKTIDKIKGKALNRFPLPDIIEDFIQSLQNTPFTLDEVFLLFYDEVCKFSYEQGNNIIELLKFWEKELKYKTYTSSEIPNSIRILTIHKSKGLESKIVMILYKSSNKDNQSYILTELSNLTHENIDKNKYLFIFGKNKYISNLAEKNEKITIQLHSNTLSQINERLNLLYVATTRPKEGLILYISGSDAITQILEKTINDMSPTLLEKNENYIEKIVGKIPYNKKSQENTPTKTLNNLKLYSKDWREYVTLLLTNEKEYKKNMFQLQAPATIGKYTHKILFNYTLYNKLPNNLPENEKKLIQNFLELKANNKIINSIFSGNYKLFPELPVKDEELYIIDLLAINQKNIYILEYKTGNPEEEHITQVETYKKIIKKQFPEHKIKSLLVYLNSKQVIEI